MTELKIPAQAEYVIVAKRAASALATTAGFSLEGVDDLNIAVAQACEKAIVAGERMWGPDNGTLKLTFHLVDDGIEVEVRTMPQKEDAAEAIGKRDLELARRAESYRRAATMSAEVAAERTERLAAQREARRLAALRRPVPASSSTAPDVDLEDLAVNMIRLFVDELRYNVDSRGGMRMRMVKYHVD